tara:strand:- start:1023 stop:1163 length:141 start_codon:yes stop_codon:yes gene_type:complete
VLLLEAGEEEISNPAIGVPARALELQLSDVDWCYQVRNFRYFEQVE